MGLFDTIWRLTGIRPVKHVRRQKRAKSRVIQVEKPKRQKKTPTTEHVTLQEWKTELQKLQTHPLTQAKIINERVLNSILNLLEDLNSKMDGLVERLRALESKESRIIKPGLTKPKITFRLTKKEERIINLIKKKRKILAKDIARSLRVSRSNASLKLNKLYSIGALEKKQSGKGVFYKIKR